MPDSGRPDQAVARGRRRGRRVMAPPVQEEGAESRFEETKEAVRGVGRGGRPRGGGRGNCCGGEEHDRRSRACEEQPCRRRRCLRERTERAVPGQTPEER